jgi:hypothetical protein
MERQVDSEDHRDKLGIGTGGSSDVENFIGVAKDCPRGNHGPLDVCHGLSRFLDKSLTGVGQFHPLMIALKEMNIKLAFQFDNPLAESGLVNVQPFCRSGEVQFLGQSDSRLQQSCFWKNHSCPPRRKHQAGTADKKKVEWTSLPPEAPIIEGSGC